MTEQCGHESHKHHEEHEKYSKGGCGCGCGDPAEKFLELSEVAWRELLIEEIKSEIKTKNGEHIKKLAALIADTSSEKWKFKMAAKAKYFEFKDSLKEYLKSK